MPQKVILKNRDVSIVFNVGSLADNPLNAYTLIDILPSADFQPLTLLNTQSISFSYSMPVAVESGITANFLQPWFLAPTKLSIKGKDYIGFSNTQTDYNKSFSGSAYPITDNAAQTLVQLFAVISSLINLGQLPTATITIGKYGDPGYISLTGYFTDPFNFSEDVKNPYLLDYDLTFIGEDSNVTQQKDAVESAAQDNATNGSASPGIATKPTQNYSHPICAAADSNAQLMSALQGNPPPAPLALMSTPAIPLGSNNAQITTGPSLEGGFSQQPVSTNSGAVSTPFASTSSGSIPYSTLPAATNIPSPLSDNTGVIPLTSTSHTLNLGTVKTAGQ